MSPSCPSLRSRAGRPTRSQRLSERSHSRGPLPLGRAQRHFSLGIGHLPLAIGDAKCQMSNAQCSMCCGERPGVSLADQTTNPHSVTSSSGFTLIEMVISASLMALILTSAYLCLNAAMESQKLIEPRADAIQTARVAMALMSADLRSACSLSKDFDLLGMQRTVGAVEADNIDFATHNYTPRHPHEGDYCEESFFLDKDPRSGQWALWRRRNPTLAPNPLSGGYREELARGVLGLRFEYYDGIDWYDSWGDINGAAKQASSYRERSNLMGLPEAVRITLLLDADPTAKAASQNAGATNEPGLFFQTVVRLELADSLSSSSSAGGETNAPAENSGQQGGTP